MKHTFTLALLLSSLTSFAQQYELTLAFPNLPAFNRALDLQHASDTSNRLFVVQQLGLIYQFDNNSDVSARKVFLDLSNRVSQNADERGLLGLAFHPNFAQNGFIYVNYTAGEQGITRSFVSRFQASGENHDTVLRSTEKILLRLDQPASNHNGGWIAFGPDGYLYTSFGDGGGGGDQWNNAQSKDTLFGKILRLDVDNGDPYSIPSTNPFFSGGGRKEIYAYGLRNAWRCSFDPVTNKLWAGDVGQNKWEEVDTIISGGNYGWRVKEGYHCYNPSSDCDSTGFQSPIWEYSHSVGFSITGGYVYRGASLPSLYGKYIYADLSGKIWALTYEGLPLAQNVLLASLGKAIASFGTDQNNELYVVAYEEASSQLYKFKPIAGVAVDDAGDGIVKIYPNPAQGILRIEAPIHGISNISIADIAGKIIMNYDISDLSFGASININNLANGSYFVVVRSGNEYRKCKFVVKR